MTSHRALKALAENSDAVRGLALALLKIGAGDSATGWSDWELDFLDGMASRDSDEPLSMRQREKLDELKSSTERYAQINGLGVRRLIERCWAERLDLESDDDQEYIDQLKNSGAHSVSRRQLGRLLRCCRDLGLIEAHQCFV